MRNMRDSSNANTQKYALCKVFQFYRPHAKYEGRYCFDKCRSVLMGGIPILSQQGSTSSGPDGAILPSYPEWWGGGVPPSSPDRVPHLVPTGVTLVGIPHPTLGHWTGCGLHRLCRGRYASCGFPQEDFLFLLCVHSFCSKV